MYLRLSLILLLIFTAALLLIHTQPYDDHELRQFLLPTAGCPAPCFMGIRPGVTKVEEAIKILEASGWLDRYNYEQQDATAIRIKWNDNRPAWLGSNMPYGQTTMWIRNGLVEQIFVETNVMLGAVDLSIGRPPFQHISLNYNNGQYYLFYVALYPTENINISISRDCEHQSNHINYLDKAFLNYGTSDIGTNIPPSYHHPWLDVIHTLCR
ncbi:MAG: hypothetical protein H0X30_07910 [Anaerolineae bacterium]|nr:hypothetical protein [Anaerolineae bacterium]